MPLPLRAPTPYHFRWEQHERGDWAWISRKGWSASIWEEPGVFRINTGPGKPVSTSRKSQEVGGGSTLPPSAVLPLSSSPPLSVFPRASRVSPRSRHRHPISLGGPVHLSFSLCSCSQLERSSGTWAASSLRRTFSFLLSMTGKTKVGVRRGSRGPGTHGLPGPARRTETRGRARVLRGCVAPASPCVSSPLLALRRRLAAGCAQLGEPARGLGSCGLAQPCLAVGLA